MTMNAVSNVILFTEAIALHAMVFAIVLQSLGDLKAKEPNECRYLGACLSKSDA